MQYHFEMEPPRWHTLFAWGFLEDVYRLRTVPVDGHTRLWPLARMLGSCATNLRNACEAKFDRKLAEVPNQDLMWFISAARHLNAHGGSGGAIMQVRESELHLPPGSSEGEMRSRGFITIVLDGLKEMKDPSARECAERFLKDHNNSLYPALHAATREVANWTGATTDTDFERMGHEDHGAMTWVVPLKSSRHRDQMLRAYRGIGEVTAPSDELDCPPWGIDGQWIEPESI